MQEKSFQGAASASARLKLLAAAESCLGTPYRYAGLDRRGLDCSGLVYLSFREALNYTIPRTAENIYAWVEKIPKEELEPGDLVFFTTIGQKVSHLGIYTGERRFIHSASEGPHTGVIYSSLDEDYWKRRYTGAGRALPWDAAAAQAMASAGASAQAAGEDSAAVTAQDSAIASAQKPEEGPAELAAAFSPPVDSGPADTNPAGLNPGLNPIENTKKAAPAWTDPGFFAGFGAAFTFGGFIEGAPSIFRGFSAFAVLGYKWTKIRTGLEIRPEWDRALNVFRFPLTISFGTENFQIFAGPAYTSGTPRLNLSTGERRYSGGGSWLWEAGFSAAFPPIRIGPGALSFYSELAWQPYLLEDETAFDFKPDFTANLRLSTGLRYLWHARQ